MNDDLYDRLRAADPLSRSVPVEAGDTFNTRDLMEAAMSTDRTSNPHRPRWIPLVASAGTAAAIVGGVLLFGSDRVDDGAGSGEAPLQLSLPGEAGTSMSSCIPFSVDELARMPVAFAGTVVGVDGVTVNLAVDTWYSGGVAPNVKVAAPGGASTALLGEIEFVDGEQYLITATAGNVNLCGFSGMVAPELRAAFEEAF